MREGSVLDVGCGRGDLLPYLRERSFEGSYMGVDLTPEMIELARELHPDGEFRHVDLLQDDFEGQFDYVLASGIFYLRVDDNETYMRQMVARMASIARRGVAFNALSTLAGPPEPTEYHHDPCELF